MAKMPEFINVRLNFPLEVYVGDKPVPNRDDVWEWLDYVGREYDCRFGCKFLEKYGSFTGNLTIPTAVGSNGENICVSVWAGSPFGAAQKLWLVEDFFDGLMDIAAAQVRITKFEHDLLKTIKFTEQR